MLTLFPNSRIIRALALEGVMHAAATLTVTFQRKLLVDGFLVLVLLATSGAFGAGPQPKLHHLGIKFKVLHNFTGGQDGGCIYGGLAKDRHDNLYGVTYCNDDPLNGNGLLFKLTRGRQGYRFRVLYRFNGLTGRACITTPTPDGFGNLFGLCREDAQTGGGTLWKYSRQGDFRVLHYFTGADGAFPQDSVALDSEGDIYGTAYAAGRGGRGTLWKYSLNSKTFIVLHAFSNGDDGGGLLAAPRLDEKTGVVWGTTVWGPNCDDCGNGTVWSYDPSSGMFTTVSDFGATGVIHPQSRVIIDAQGNIYGTAFGVEGVRDSCGVVYELQKIGTNYQPIVLHQFLTSKGDGCDPYGRVRFDERGNLIGGTDGSGKHGCGAVYELVRKRGWKEKTLHSFDFDDGCSPEGGLKTDHKGNWFGTTSIGGKYKWGTVFEISGVH